MQDASANGIPTAVLFKLQSDVAHHKSDESTSKHDSSAPKFEMASDLNPVDLSEDAFNMLFAMGYRLQFMSQVGDGWVTPGPHFNHYKTLCKYSDWQWRLILIPEH